jgi:hypothetical protein
MIQGNSPITSHGLSCFAVAASCNRHISIPAAGLALPIVPVMVRIDNTHESHGWNWVRGRVLSMDKGTVRGLIGAKIFKVQVGTENDSQIAEFSPAGLKLDRVKQACGLTPRKTSK